MRKLWLTTFTALICAAGFATTSVVADPVSMAMSGRRAPAQQSTFSIWPWSKSSSTPTAAPQPMVGLPSEQVSATHHPIKYLESAISEMPIVSKVKGKWGSTQHPVMPPASEKPDSLALDTPIGPPSPDVFIYAAQTCEQQGDVPQARKNLQHALRMWPGNVEVLRAAARMEDRQGNLPLAENLYGQAVTSNPQNAASLNDLGLCLARQGKLEPSLQMLEQAIQLQPAKALYRNNAATLLVEMHQDQRALAHLAAVHGPADANYNLGQLLVERNRGSEAGPYFEAALQQNPNLQAAQEALAKLHGTGLVVSAPPAATQPTGSQSQVSQSPVQPGPPVAPQQGWPTAPQANNYPATARFPATGTTGAVVPQYLPPVASRQAPVVR